MGLIVIAPEAFVWDNREEAMHFCDTPCVHIRAPLGGPA